MLVKFYFQMIFIKKVYVSFILQKHQCNLNAIIYIHNIKKKLIDQKCEKIN